MITALHSGDMGDVIYSIPTLKKLNVHKIVLNSYPLFGTKMDEKACSLLKPLLISQGFDIEVTDVVKRSEIDFDMDQFRCTKQDLSYTHLAKSQAKTFKIDQHIDWEKPFLKIDYPSKVADIVINRTDRYQNGQFDWFYLLNDIRSKIVFIGTKDEYDRFCRHTLLKNVGYFPTKNLLEAAKVIAGAKVFIGNQSTPYAISEGMKVNRIQETSREVPNCKGLSDNAIDVEDRTDLFFAKAKLHEWLGIPFDSEAKIPKKVMLYTTAYVEDDYGYDRIKKWIEFYLPRKEKLGFTHMCIIDDGSPVVWLEKLNEEIGIDLKMMEYVQHESGAPMLVIPRSLSDVKANCVRFPNRLGRPHHGRFPGWWRSYSFGAELAHLHDFDKILFIESDAYLLTDRIFEFLNNQNSGFGSMYSPVSKYRETSIQWCMVSESSRIRQFWMARGNIREDFWHGINIPQTHYVPEYGALTFTNDLEIVKQFIGDRYGDDHYPEIPNCELDFICNVTDISLNGIYHKGESAKQQIITEKLKSVSV